MLHRVLVGLGKSAEFVLVDDDDEELGAENGRGFLLPSRSC